MQVKYVLAVLAILVVMTGAGFTVEASVSDEFSPAPFDDTLEVGLAGVDVRQAADANLSIPRAQVFFSQYQYVIGYHGVGAAAHHLGTGQTTEQFGRPLAVLVTDYTGTEPYLTDEGYIKLRNGVALRWVSAADASFVVDSRARTPGGRAVVPFSSESAARSFARSHDGRVVSWDGLLAERGDDVTDTGQIWRGIVTNRTAWADMSVEDARSLTDRPVSVVVGRDAPTLSAALEQAPPNTTIRLPGGEYDGNLTVSKPVTITGAGNGTHIRGRKTGTVLHVTAPRTAITDLRISGVGPNGSQSSAGADGWNETISVAYGQGDSAIRFDKAAGSLVSNVHIDTQATGILVRHSPRTVVTNSSINGTDTQYDGFMGVLGMFDPIVVQDTRIVGGRDGVYTHRTEGIVVRDNRMVGMRYGVHEMYTSGSLVSNNTMRETNAGIIVMTRPRENVLLGNDVRRSEFGILTEGTASFTIDNIVAENDIGLSLGAVRSVTRGNVVLRNDLGIRADTLMPSNTVVANDIVGNERQAEAGLGPTRIWTAERGNYWGRLPGRDRDGDGTLDSSYYPVGEVDSNLLGTPGIVTLRNSPAVALHRAVRSSVPGLRVRGIVDRAPLTDPVHPDILRNLTTHD